MKSTTKESLFPVSASQYPYSKSALSSDSKPYLAAREETRLTLRKRRLDDHLQKKREELLKQREAHSQYEISLSALSLPPEMTSETFSSSKDFITKMISYLQTNSLSIKKFAILKLRQATTRQEAIDEMYTYNVIDYLFPLMNDNAQDNSIVYEVLWILINITTAYSSQELTTKLLSEYSFNFYINEFVKNIPDIKESILWLLNNAIFGNEQAATLFMNSPFLQEKLIPYLQEEQSIVKSVLKHAILLLSTMCGLLNYTTQITRINDRYAKTEAEITKIFCTFLTADPSFVSDCIFGLSKISNSPNEKVHTILFDSGIIRQVVKNSFTLDIPLTYPILLVGNFLSNIEDSSLIDSVFTKEIITYLGGFIVNSGDNQIVHDALWALSNLCCGTSEQMNQIIDNGLVPIMISKIKGPNNHVGYEGVYCISNLLTCEDINIIIKVAGYDIIEILISIIEKYYQNPKAILIIMNSFRALFIEGQKIISQTDNQNLFLKTFWEKGGKDILDKLQNYQDKEVYELVCSLIKEYFSY